MLARTPDIVEEEHVGCTKINVKESLPEEKEEGAATNKYSYTCEYKKSVCTCGDKDA